jgi:hypothetical protein
MTISPKLVVIDTNCLVRIYFSPLRPILSRSISGYELKTLDGLARELKNLANRSDLAWLSDSVILAEVDAATISLTKLQRDAINLEALGTPSVPGIQQYGNSVLRKEYENKKLRALRTLSLNDAKALAASLVLDAALATDEWPLRLVAEDYDSDNGEPIELLSSVELIELLEREKLITREIRVKTYSDWLKNGEALLRESPEIYRRRFSEDPPTAQG